MSNENYLANLSKVVGEACDKWLASRGFEKKGWKQQNDMFAHSSDRINLFRGEMAQRDRRAPPVFETNVNAKSINATVIMVFYII